MTVKRVYKSVQSLRPTEKAQLVEMILTDLDQPDKEIEKAWVEEANRRWDELRSGKVKPLTYQDVMGKYI
jgi:putative addiction module component (TIGR02574 family)